MTLFKIVSAAIVLAMLSPFITQAHDALTTIAIALH